MEAKHTPWKVGPHPWPEQIGCCPLVGRPWSVHGTDYHNVAAAVSEDIARLIAAAPDLLEALRRIAEASDHYGNEADAENKGADTLAYAHKSTCNLARAAIAKATGEASHGE